MADENFPFPAVQAIENQGHDIAWVAPLAPGLDDRSVLERTRQEGRILLTFDKDFGELAMNVETALGFGIILFRIPMPNPLHVGARLTALVIARDDWAGHFSVIEPGRVRMRPLKQPPTYP